MARAIRSERIRLSCEKRRVVCFSASTCSQSLTKGTVTWRLRSLSRYSTTTAAAKPPKTVSTCVSVSPVSSISVHLGRSTEYGAGWAGRSNSSHHHSAPQDAEDGLVEGDLGLEREVGHLLVAAEVLDRFRYSACAAA